MWQQLRVSLCDRYLGTQESRQLREHDEVDIYRTASGSNGTFETCVTDMGGQARSEQGRLERTDRVPQNVLSSCPPRVCAGLDIWGRRRTRRLRELEKTQPMLSLRPALYFSEEEVASAGTPVSVQGL